MMSIRASRLVLVAIPVILCLAAFALAAERDVPAKGTTLANLMTAFDGESNANAKYIEFAKKADEEGFLGVASLFRAAAKAEAVHAANHAEVIRGMGGEPKATIILPEIKTTAENLKAAVAGETYERDTMYPGFVAQARKERNREALRSFNYAMTAEAEHAKLYQSALDSMDKWTKARTFYVCDVCGFTTEKVDFAKCPSCFSPKERYFAVS